MTKPISAAAITRPVRHLRLVHPQRPAELRMREQNITATGHQMGYAFSQWRMGWQGFARVDDNVRALKITSGAGFRCIELTAGTGPWDPLGRPESIAMNFGSVRKFAAQLGDWGIDRITGVFLDPGQMSFEEGHFGLKCTARADHAVILAQAGVHARFVAEVGGSYLVIQPIPSFGKEGSLTPAALEAAAELINWEANKSLGSALSAHRLSSALRSTECSGCWRSAQPRTSPLRSIPLNLPSPVDVVALYRRFHARVRHFHFRDALAIDSLGEYKLPIREGDDSAGSRSAGSGAGRAGDFDAHKAMKNELRGMDHRRKQGHSRWPTCRC